MKKLFKLLLALIPSAVVRVFTNHMLYSFTQLHHTPHLDWAFVRNSFANKAPARHCI